MATEKQTAFINALKSSEISMWRERTLDQYATAGMETFRWQYATKMDAARELPTWKSVGNDPKLDTVKLAQAAIRFLESIPVPSDTRAASKMIDDLKNGEYLVQFAQSLRVEDYLK